MRLALYLLLIGSLLTADWLSFRCRFAVFSELIDSLFTADWLSIHC